MSEKSTLDSMYDTGTELLKDGGELLDSINPFDDEKESKENINLETKQEIKKAKDDFDPEGKIIINATLTKLKSGYEKLYEELPDDYKAKLKVKYEKIVTDIKSCKNDGELKTKYNKIKTDIDLWITDLSKEPSSSEKLYSLTNSAFKKVKIETINSLYDLQGDLALLEGTEKQKEVRESLNKKKESLYKDTEEKNEIESMLTKIGVPVGIAGMIAGLLAWFGIGKNETSMFSDAFAFMKNPMEGVKGFFGFGKDKEIKSETITKGELKKDGDLTTYINETLNIELDKKEIKSIEIDGDEYILNSENIGDISIVQNDKDILKIGNKEVDLFTLIKELKEDKDSYTLIKNFDNSSNLKLEKK